MALAQTIEFRFKVPEISPTTPLSQSLLVNRTGSTNTSTQFGIYLEYTGSLSSGSYSGSVVNPYYQYGNLKFIHPDAGVSASIYLPFFNGDWWSVMVTKKDDPYITYDLYAVNKTLNEYGQYVIQYQGSSSLQTPYDWKKPGQTLIPGSGSSSILGKTYVPATGSFQEVRYYNVPLSQSQFNDFGVNSNSIEGNTLNSSYDELFFRAALGGELFTGSTSIHPAVNETPSFDSGNSNFGYTGSFSFISNTEIHYYDQVPAGIQNPVSQKIKQQNIVLPYSSSNTNIPNSNVLSPFISIQQSPSVSQSFTRDIDYVEVAFSPQNEINDDINDELGYFNIGELIGDPRFQSSSLEYYPDLNALSNSYFKKYDSNYDWNDYIRLIKFFDNSLFKMLVDWIPARASLAAGVVIKNTLLDRNRYRTPQVSTAAVLANIGSGSTNIPYVVEDQTITGSIDVGTVEGGNGGTMPDLLGQTSSLFTYPGAININQVWDGSTPSLFGAIPFVESSQTEFYNGALSGSNLVVTDGVLSDPTVITPVVYTTSSVSVAYTFPTFFYNIPLEEGFARVTGSENIINYNFKSEKTYYLSFTASVGNYGFPLQMVIVNADRSFNPVSVTLNSATNIIQDLEVTDLLPYIYFLNINGVANTPAPLNPITLTNFIVKESELLDPENYVVENDVQVSRPSSKYLDIDFATNYITAVNEQAILSGSATKATVPDSNYTSLKSANPRYFGCQNDEINEYVKYFAYFDYLAAGSTYNGGSNIHIINLVDIEGNIITLTPENRNLFNVEQTFKQGDPVYAYQINGTSVTTLPEMTIVTGGALYTTVLVKSGSGDISNAGLTVNANVINNFSNLFFISGSNPPTTSSLILNNPISPNPNWLDHIISGSIFNSVTSYTTTGTPDLIQIFNKSADGLRSGTIPVDETLFPIQYGDFIRFGDSTVTGAGVTSSLDYSWNNGFLYNIITTNTNNLIAPLSSSLQITPSAHSYPQLVSNQAFKIIRRVPNETFVVINQALSNTSGLLVPYNFDPKYSPSEIALRIGLI